MQRKQFPVFGRKTEAESQPALESDVKEGGKGRPTPTRKEAEAAARDRAKASANPKSASRQQRISQGAKMREGMRTGDDRYLPARDQGPVKRFVRDWVDSHVTVLEWIMPAMLIILLLQTIRQTVTYSQALFQVVFIVMLLDGLRVRFRVRRAVRERFPDESGKGIAFYALARAINPRPLRMPKTQVKVGGQPIDRSKKK